MFQSVRARRFKNDKLNKYMFCLNITKLYLLLLQTTMGNRKIILGHKYPYRVFAWFRYLSSIPACGFICAIFLTTVAP